MGGKGGEERDISRCIFGQSLRLNGGKIWLGDDIVGSPFIETARLEVGSIPQSSYAYT